MTDTQIIPIEHIGQLIRIVRDHKVLLDSDLAQLYGVTTGNLNKAVRRNRDRFPEDFMFQLTTEENRVLLFQNGTTKPDVIEKRGGRRRSLPMAFTEQGVAMLSSVLNSPRAVQVNIVIMRTFVRLRKVLATNSAIAKRLEKIELKLIEHDEQFEAVFDAIEEMLSDPEDSQKRPIGFGRDEER